VLTDDLQSSRELPDDDRFGLDAVAFLQALVAEGDGRGRDGTWVRRQDRRQDRPPSFRVITTIGRELVDAFAALHSAGLCYRDISFGNLRVDQAAREAEIIDVDNVGVDGGSA
jgi:hypothetical protein